MSTKIWYGVFAAVAVSLAACEREGSAENRDESAETEPSNPTAPGDQTTTPGGVAGETAATPPGTQPDAYPPDSPASDAKDPGE